MPLPGKAREFAGLSYSRVVLAGMIETMEIRDKERLTEAQEDAKRKFEPLIKSRGILTRGTAG